MLVAFFGFRDLWHHTLGFLVGLDMQFHFYINQQELSADLVFLSRSLGCSDLARLLSSDCLALLNYSISYSALGFPRLGR